MLAQPAQPLLAVAGLVRAISFEGLRLLADRLGEVPVTDDPRADVVALLAASRRFAIERPMLFEVMYARPIGELSPAPEDLRATILRVTGVTPDDEYYAVPAADGGDFDF